VCQKNNSHTDVVFAETLSWDREPVT